MKLFKKALLKKIIKKIKTKPKKEEKKMEKKVKKINKKVVETENVKINLPLGNINETINISITPNKPEVKETINFKDLKEDERICPVCGSIMKITSHGAMSTSYKCTNTQCNKGWTF